MAVNKHNLLDEKSLDSSILSINYNCINTIIVVAKERTDIIVVKD